MPGESTSLSVVAIPGLIPETLGHYLAALGLLRVTARRWPSVRAAWNAGLFHLVGGPEALDEVLEYMCKVAAENSWTPYTRGWLDAQKRSTKAKSGAPLSLWQTTIEENEIEMVAAHAVPTGKMSLNPLLGKGGSAGNRDFSDGWSRAVDALAAAQTKKNAPDKRAELRALLLAEAVTWRLEKLNAASWFSDANKIYNSGQRSFRDGAISPWSMVLACEGLPFFAGTASRRLGARSRAAGAFPFVTYAAGPQTAGEAGRETGEMWAPVWKRPMTLREVATLFSRGRAEVNGRGVLSPSGFAVAVLRRGVDAGVSEFRRFVLGRTTSANTFESRFEGVLKVGAEPQEGGSMGAMCTALERMLHLVEHLPRDVKKGDRWRFIGLRGPMEAALLRAAAKPLDSEAACSLLDTMVSVLDRIDRNRGFRERELDWEPLPLAWLPSLFDDGMNTEARLALACVSSFPVDLPFAMYRFGIQRKGTRLVHTKSPPARWIWRAGPIPTLLTNVLQRRTLDRESKANERLKKPVRFIVSADAAHIERWLSSDVDEEVLLRWISRLALFDWGFVPETVRSLATQRRDIARATGALCLVGLFQPLFDLRPVRLTEDPMDLFPEESGARTPAVARKLANFLRRGELDSAIRIATNRYAMGGTSLMSTTGPWAVDDPDRLLASMLFTLTSRQQAALVERWLRPRLNKGEISHA